MCARDACVSVSFFLILFPAGRGGSGEGREESFFSNHHLLAEKPCPPIPPDAPPGLLPVPLFCQPCAGEGARSWNAETKKEVCKISKAPSLLSRQHRRGGTGGKKTRHNHNASARTHPRNPNFPGRTQARKHARTRAPALQDRPRYRQSAAAHPTRPDAPAPAGGGLVVVDGGAPVAPGCRSQVTPPSVK